MMLWLLRWLPLGFTAACFAYYVMALIGARRFFARTEHESATDFSPPVSILKPLRGTDPDCYKNLASFCRQDYPEYEVLYCVGEPGDPAAEVVRQIQRDYPDRNVRLLIHTPPPGQNDKVAKLAFLARQARYPILVVSDSDVRVAPDYLRKVVAPLARPEVGLVTCLYKSTPAHGWVSALETLAQVSDFYPGLIVDWQLEEVKFALGSTIALRAEVLREIGGWEPQVHQVADDLLLGRRVAQQGYRVILSPYTVCTVPDYQSLKQFLLKRLRWTIVLRHMRPWGHLGLACTQALPWVVWTGFAHGLATAIPIAGIYLLLRTWMAWEIGVRGLGLRHLVRKFWLIPLWDALASAIWLISFTRRTILWRGANYTLGKNAMITVTRPAGD